jgi:hypothetical protein
MGFEVKHHWPVEMIWLSGVQNRESVMSIRLRIENDAKRADTYPGMPGIDGVSDPIVIANKIVFTLNQNVAKKNTFDACCARHTHK